MATTKDAGWETTRYGGLRRSQSTRSSSGSRTSASARPLSLVGDTAETGKPETSAGVEGKKETVGGGTERHSEKVEVGGSNPHLRDQFILKLNERLGLPSCPYVVRWRFETPWFSIRLHHWLAPDDDRARHDHPWSFTTFVLKGGYTDVSPSGDEHLRAPAVRHRKAEHQHTVFPDPDGAWTIIVTGAKTRQWGFWVKGKFVKSYRYFYKFGHHPCE